MRPPGDDERRPLDKGAALGQSPAKAADVSMVAPSADSEQMSADEIAWLATWQAEQHVPVKGCTVAAMRAMSTPVPPSMRFVGLVEDSRRHVHEELDRRGGSW